MDDRLILNNDEYDELVSTAEWLDQLAEDADSLGQVDLGMKARLAAARVIDFYTEFDRLTSGEYQSR